jgi:LysM repeat protein
MRKQWTTAALVMSLGLAVPAFAQDDPTTQAPADKESSADRERAAEERANQPAADAELNGDEYVVQSGDTLSGIAERFLGSADQWKQIAQANDIDNPDMISVGMKLEIPQGANAPAAEPASRSESESSAPSGTTMPAPDQGAGDTDLPSDDEGTTRPEAR